MTNLLELLLALVAGAAITWFVVRAVGWLVEILPSSILPGFMLGLVVLLLVLFALAAALRVGRLA